jgi:hypothetical protein
LATCASRAEQLLGLPLEAAIAAAIGDGYVVRLVKQDGREFVLTMDFATRRINLEVEGGIVVAASPG